MMSTTTVATDLIERAVTLACRAPSYHNSQPWRWVADRDGLHLSLDRSRIVESDLTGQAPENDQVPPPTPRRSLTDVLTVNA
jgi:hypothetical protein